MKQNDHFGRTHIVILFLLFINYIYYFRRLGGVKDSGASFHADGPGSNPGQTKSMRYLVDERICSRHHLSKEM